ncbi:hypothetical protein MRB53_041131 [Persea americana]|nr:hypothetical protein MRB53_041131 [Persea americana]
MHAVRALSLNCRASAAALLTAIELTIDSQCPQLGGAHHSGRFVRDSANKLCASERRTPPHIGISTLCADGRCRGDTGESSPGWPHIAKGHVNMDRPGSRHLRHMSSTGPVISCQTGQQACGDSLGRHKIKCGTLGLKHVATSTGYVSGLQASLQGPVAATNQALASS